MKSGWYWPYSVSSSWVSDDEEVVADTGCDPTAEDGKKDWFVCQ